CMASRLKPGLQTATFPYDLDLRYSFGQRRLVGPAGMSFALTFDAASGNLVAGAVPNQDFGIRDFSFRKFGGRMSEKLHEIIRAVVKRAIGIGDASGLVNRNVTVGNAFFDLVRSRKEIGRDMISGKNRTNWLGVGRAPFLLLGEDTPVRHQPLHRSTRLHF